MHSDEEISDENIVKETNLCSVKDISCATLSKMNKRSLHFSEMLEIIMLNAASMLKQALVTRD